SCLKGYGIKRSSVSRHWKAATAKELEALMQRPIPKDLLVLMIDSKFFGGDCLVAAIGIDLQGSKHVFVIWPAATENSTVVSVNDREVASCRLNVAGCKRRVERRGARGEGRGRS